MLAVSTVLIRRLETRVEIERLASIARPLALRSNIDRIAADEQSSPRLPRRLRAARLDDQAAELEVRLLVIDGEGAVVHDSAPDTPVDDQALRRLEPLAAALGEADRVAGGRQVSLGPRSDRSPFPGDIVIASTVRGSPSGDVLILVSTRGRYPLLRRALGPLALITLVSLAGASLGGLALSRRIARPVERLTEAVDAMAAGTLDQRVPGEGGDELGRLVASFNAMSGRVATASRSQRDLLADVAHELRTPLTSIRGFSRAIVDGVIRTDADRDRAVATIDREAKRMSDLIAGLLDLARLEAGAVAIAREPVAVAPLLDEVAGRFAVQAEAAGVSLTTSTDGDPTALGDAPRLLQVVSNLVANAVAHTPAGGTIHLSGRASAGVDGSRVAIVTVADTGSGIAPDRIGRIFQRFDRGDETAGRPGGFGLGLAIVRELVDLHGGRISVESTPPRGTTFTLTLPASQEARTRAT